MTKKMKIQEKISRKFPGDGNPDDLAAALWNTTTSKILRSILQLKYYDITCKIL